MIKRSPSLHLLAVVALVILCTRQLIFAPLAHLLAAPDLEQYFVWIHLYIKRELLAGRLPLWNPHIYAGTPLAANPQATLFYPPAWLYLLMPVPAAERLLILLHVALAGAFMYLWLRRVCQSRVAAMIGAMPFALGGYMMANAAVGHLTMLFTAAWLPLAMYCVDRACDGPPRWNWRWIAAAGATLGVQVLAGEPQNSYYTAVGVAVYALGRSSSSLAHVGRSCLALVVIALAAGSVAAVQLLPTAELAMQSDRSANTAEYATAMSLHPPSLIGFLVPWSIGVRAIGVVFDGSPQPFEINTNWEFAAYLGILPLLLAGIGLVLARGPASRGVRAVLLVAIVLALGGVTPVYALLLKIVPGLNLFRIPARALLLIAFSLSTLSAFGLDWLLASAGDRPNWRRRGWRLAITNISLVALLLLAIFERHTLLYLVESGPEQMQWQSPATSPLRMPQILLGACLLLAIASAWMNRRVFVTAMCAIVVIDLLLATPQFTLKPFAPRRDDDVALMSRLNASIAKDNFRIDLPPQIKANAAMFAGAQNVNGYWPLSIGRFYRYVHAMRGVPPQGGDRHELAAALYDTANPFPLPVLSVARAGRYAQSEIAIAENPAPLPRAWIVADAERVADEDEALARMKSASFDPRQTVLLESTDPPHAATPVTGSCATVELPGGELRITTETSADAYLVLSQIHYPGWRAMIDDQPAPLLRADDLITAIRLPSGRHVVRCWYAPASVYLGAAISLISIIAGATIIVPRRNVAAISRTPSA